MRRSTFLSRVLPTILLMAGATLGTVAAGPAAPAHAKVPGPNGRIAFAIYNPAVGDDAIYTANPDGSDVIQIFAGPAESPRWSPDGNRISVVCFQGDFEFVRNCTMNPDGSGLVQLVPDATLNQGVGPWSPDGTHLAVEGWDDVQPERTPGIFTMRSSDGGDLTRVTTNPYGGHDIPLDYAPDGSRLLFARENPPGGKHSHALFIVHLNGSGLRQLTPWGLDAGDGSWSPDGTKIAFSSNGGIFLINEDGTGTVKIHQDTQSGASFEPCWSPDGTKILFASIVVDRSEKQRQEDLYTMNPDGTDIRQITDTRSFEGAPDWGPYLP